MNKILMWVSWVCVVIILTVGSRARAVEFTSAFSIDATNQLYEGEELIINGCTGTVDGVHVFNSLLMTNGRHADAFSRKQHRHDSDGVECRSNCCG